MSTLTSLYIPWFLQHYPRLIPRTLHSISLRFREPQQHLLKDGLKEHWQSLDKFLAGPLLPHLTYVEVLWVVDCKFSVTHDFMRDMLDGMYSQGAFATYFPGLYKQGILWCGSCNSLTSSDYPRAGDVFLVSEGSRKTRWSMWRRSMFDEER